jgi:hypothetical protein
MLYLNTDLKSLLKWDHICPFLSTNSKIRNEDNLTEKPY